MPWEFSPLERGPPFTTSFQVLVGKGTAFEGPEGFRFKEDFGVRMSDTILIAEAANPVPWTKPDDMLYDENKPLPELGAFFKGSFHIALADASSRDLPQQTDMVRLRSAIVRTGPGPGEDW